MKGPADKVDECIDELLNLEEEYLQELADRDEDDRYIPPTSRQNQKQGGKGGKGQPKTQKVLYKILVFKSLLKSTIIGLPGLKCSLVTRQSK